MLSESTNGFVRGLAYVHAWLPGMGPIVAIRVSELRLQLPHLWLDILNRRRLYS